MLEQVLVGVQFHSNRKPFFLDTASRASPEHLQTYLCHYVINILPLLSFSSTLLLLMWCFLEMHDFRLLSTFMNHWGSYGNANSDWKVQGGARFFISNFLLGNASASSSKLYPSPAGPPVDSLAQRDFFFNVLRTY